MSPRNFTYRQGRDGFPRVSGDEPGNFGELKSLIEFSPRERV